MTTSASGRKLTSACNGATMTFANPKVQVSADLKIYLLNSPTDDNAAGTLLSEGIDYTLSPDLATTTTLTAYPVGKYLRRWRQTSRAQQIEIAANQGLPAATQEGVFDRLSLVDEEIDEDVSRSVRVPPGETLSALPARAMRAGKFVAFDAQGDWAPSAGTGNDPNLRADLSAADGVRLLGFDPLATYPAGSLGAYLKGLISGPAVADEAIAAGKLVNLTVTLGVTHMRLADASDPTKPAHAFAPLTVAPGATGTWVRRGIIPGTSGVTFAPALWLSDATPGAYTSAAPSTVGHLSQHVGMVLPGIGVEFDPQLEIYL
jgi:hypothetical protein